MPTKHIAVLAVSNSDYYALTSQLRIPGLSFTKVTCAEDIEGDSFDSFCATEKFMEQRNADAIIKEIIDLIND